MSKKRKGLIACLMLVALCFTLIACVSDPASFYFDYDELKDTVVAIELINYDNSDVKTIKKKEDILPFDFDKMEIVETLNSGQMENLLFDLAKIHFHIRDDMTRYLSSATGISIRIIYASGDFIVFCFNQETNFVGEFTNDGDIGEFMLYYVFSSDFPSFSAFIDLVNTYFETKIS